MVIKKGNLKKTNSTTQIRDLYKAYTHDLSTLTSIFNKIISLSVMIHFSLLQLQKEKTKKQMNRLKGTVLFLRKLRMFQPRSQIKICKKEDSQEDSLNISKQILRNLNTKERENYLLVSQIYNFLKSKVKRLLEEEFQLMPRKGKQLIQLSNLTRMIKPNNRLANNTDASIPMKYLAHLENQTDFYLKTMK